jgi:LacI family transcriptional regulator
MESSPVILLALPFSFREGVDEYNGVMRFLRERKLPWDLRIVRHSYTADLFRDSSIADLSGIICGMDFIPNVTGYAPRYPFDILALAEKSGVPFVGVDVPVEERCRSGKGRTVLLNVDSRQIGAEAAHVLFGLNCASYGFVSAFSDLAWSKHRRESFTEELQRIGKVSVNYAPDDAMQDDAVLVDWLRSLPKPCGVFASNDYCANHILRVSSANKIKVPDDLAVLGVDDDPVFCVHTKPSLSSLHPDFEAEGYAAAKAMAALLSGRRISRLSMVGGTVTCTHRTSTAPCSPAGRLVRKAEEIIAARALTGLSSDILASELGISRRLLDQRFRQITGRSVRDSVEALRLDNVKRLLKGSVLTHQEIAASSGFSSAVYLETVFVKRFGMTMSSYRASGK